MAFIGQWSHQGLLLHPAILRPRVVLLTCQPSAAICWTTVVWAAGTQTLLSSCRRPRALRGLKRNFLNAALRLTAMPGLCCRKNFLVSLCLSASTSTNGPIERDPIRGSWSLGLRPMSCAGLSARECARRTSGHLPARVMKPHLIRMGTIEILSSAILIDAGRNILQSRSRAADPKNVRRNSSVSGREKEAVTCLSVHHPLAWRT